MSREIIDREHVGRLMHESWSRTKRAQGFHWIGEPCPIAGSWDKPTTHRKETHETSCIKFHSDLIPWDDLHEKQKDINRHAFDDVLPYFERLLAQEREKVELAFSDSLRDMVRWLLVAYWSLGRVGWEKGPTMDEAGRQLLDVLCNLDYEPESKRAKQLLEREPNYNPLEKARASEKNG